MATNLYGVTADSVRRHHFPNADAWAASSRPSLATVTEAVQEEAAVLTGALAGEAIDASTITDATSSAYLSCRKTLRMMVALRIAQDMNGLEPNVVVAWKKQVKDWLDGLDEGGSLFLGDGATSSGTSEPDGPTDFISELGLEVGADEDASSVVPQLRRDDSL